MILSRDQRARLRDATAPAAKALIEDLSYIREVISRSATSSGEVRRLSAVIRRLLVDEDLKHVAAPRVGKLLISAPDRKGFYKFKEHGRVVFFASGGAPIFGLGLQGILLSNFGQKPQNLPDVASLNLLSGSATMRLDNFMAQHVLCLDNRWISRRTAIKHIGNYGSGVHTAAPDNFDDAVCAELRKSCTYTVEGAQVKVHLVPQWGAASAPFMFTLEEPWQEPYPTDSLDAVLLEVLAAGVFVVNSPGVQQLEAIIAADG